MAAFRAGLRYARAGRSASTRTRDVVQPDLIREIERRDGELVDKIIYTFPEVYNHLNK